MPRQVLQAVKVLIVSKPETADAKSKAETIEMVNFIKFTVFTKNS